MKRVAIIQSNYIPWKGYFDIIRSVDEFVIYDEVQYTTDDWRNRNRIKCPDGNVSWITIPVSRRNHLNKRISEIQVADSGWTERHWDKIRHCYSQAPFFKTIGQDVHLIYKLLSWQTFLSGINYNLIRGICDLLGVGTKISWSTDYPGGEGQKSGRLVSICRQAGATEYLSGPAAKDYLEERLFAEAGIRVEYMDYSAYPEYPQLYGPFEHRVSILDLLFNAGPQAADYIWGWRKRMVA